MATYRSNQSYLIALVLAAACWGFGAVMTKYALNQVPPLTLLVVQLVVSVVLLWTVVITQRISVSASHDAIRLGLIGVLNPGLAYTFSLLGLAQTTASMSALLWAAEPILIIGFAWLLLCERLTWSLLVCAALAIAGVGVVAGLDITGGGSTSVLGNLLIAVGVCCCALYTVVTRRMVANGSPLLIVALQQTAALLWALLIWPIELWHGGMASLVPISLGFWAWGAAGGLVYYAFAFWLYVVGLQRAPAIVAAMFLNLIPIFGVASAYLVLGERLTLAQWGGTVLILAAVTAIIRLQHQPPSTMALPRTP
jgi:drug/metabolite transporter (DMT)-like permease